MEKRAVSTVSGVAIYRVAIYRVAISTVLLLAIFPLSGCDKVKETFKSAVRQIASATPLGVTARVDVTPVNADQVARFADETELDAQDPVKLKAPVTNVAEEPGSPNALVVLPKDTEVTKVAERGNSFLVVFENPQKQDEMLIGWVPRRALESEVSAPAAPAPLACGEGQQKLAGDPEFCAKVCTDDAGCDVGARCTGIARLSDQGQPGAPVRFCVAKLEQKAEFVQKPAKASIKKPNGDVPKPERVRVSTPPRTTATSARCSPTCTDTCDCAGRPITCSPTCTDTCDCAGRPKAVARCSPTCTATCDCSGRPIKCSPTCTDTCDCAGRPKAAARCSPTCTATCDCRGRPIRCSPTCTATCDCSGKPITCSPTCTDTCDCAGRPITCSPTCTDTCDCAGRPIAAPKCSPTCTATCDCSGRAIQCSPTCTDTCDCDGRPIEPKKRERGSEPVRQVSRKK